MTESGPGCWPALMCHCQGRLPFLEPSSFLFLSLLFLFPPLFPLSLLPSVLHLPSLSFSSFFLLLVLLPSLFPLSPSLSFYSLFHYRAQASLEFTRQPRLALSYRFSRISDAFIPQSVQITCQSLFGFFE